MRLSIIQFKCFNRHILLVTCFNFKGLKLIKIFVDLIKILSPFFKMWYNSNRMVKTSGGIHMGDTSVLIEEKNKQRKVRIGRIKKIIIGSVILAILFPTVMSFFLMLKVYSLQEQMNELNKALAIKAQSSTQDAATKLADGVYATELPADKQINMLAADKVGAEKAEEKTQVVAYLTFDDGPSENTAKILDVLNLYGVKATFFVIGNDSEEAKELYKRIVEEGHTLGMHSYSHQYSDIYSSVESFEKDEKRLQDLLYESTGVIPTLYRFPGGSNNLVSNIDMSEFIKYLKRQNITYFDWNVTSGDATGQNISVERIVNNVLNQIEKYDTPVILMHDATGKDSTVEALSQIIEGLQGLGIELKPLDQSVMPVQYIEAGTINN